MKTLGIHHIAIICSDYERSQKFYVDVLGFKIIKETFRAEEDSYKVECVPLGILTQKKLGQETRVSPRYFG